jgi:protein-disulfide isomerase
VTPAPAHRGLLVAVLALGLAFGSTARAQAVEPSDMSLGDPAAKVVVIEYGSASCPHCARFNNEVFPAFKAKYVDSGRVRYVFREFLTDPVQLAAAGFLLARCGGPGKYFAILDGVFHAQDEIYQTQDASGPLMRVAHDNGLSDAQANACLEDQTAINALNARVRSYETVDHINSTPTFDVNGKRLEGEQTLAQLSVAVDHALAATTPHAHVTHVTHHRRTH